MTTPSPTRPSGLTNFPTVSVVMPVLNEERRIARALSSITRQEYPKERIEVLVADGGSADRTLNIAHSFSEELTVVVLNNPARKTEKGKTLALEHATGDLVLFLDADEWLPQPQTLQRIVLPLVTDATIVGSVAPYMYLRELPVWARYLSCDEFQRDPLVEFLTPSIEEFIVERHLDYELCVFNTHRIPPLGQTTMYRRADIDPHRWDGAWRDVDQAVYLVKQGKNRFAYVRSASLAHEHCQTLGVLVEKRIRNLLEAGTSYLRLEVQPDFVWVDTSDRHEVFRVIGWVLGTNLIVPRAIEGIARAVVQRRWEPLLRPIVALVVTDRLIVALATSPEGRRFLLRVLKGTS